MRRYALLTAFGGLVLLLSGLVGCGGLGDRGYQSRERIERALEERAITNRAFEGRGLEGITCAESVENERLFECRAVGNGEERRLQVLVSKDGESWVLLSSS